MPSDLTTIIGTNLARLRRRKGLSLDKLADLSGVSKAMLGQIERGESNPTVNTLWKIAAGLHVPFGKLMTEAGPAVAVARPRENVPLTDHSDGITLLPLFAFDPDKRFEIFTVTLPAACEHVSEPHEPGAEEYVLMAAGTLELETGAGRYTLGPEDAIHFPADKPHAYRNAGPAAVRFQNLIYYPE